MPIHTVHEGESLSRPPGDPPPVLIIPGLNNSGPDHWQSHWEAALPNAHRVEQSDWDRPTLGEWVASLVDAIRAHPGAILVGHSLGCALIAHVAHLRGRRGITGALLVAPADVNRAGPAGRLLQGFGPMPRGRLPFPTTVVASRNDPYASFELAQALARGWGADLVDLGAAGHINVESGHGPWPEGQTLLDPLIDQARTAQA
ncbi:alpha/beta hydrolase [Phenylobacterium sp. LjRoot225]|uniref:RBBP9/YdeN family alpha/beta hydrolase n=1 Tax=Phenylobacterium sp. LjRoot225 TaxID=3342285 RepID=UPI003ECE7D23